MPPSAMRQRNGAREGQGKGRGKWGSLSTLCESITSWMSSSIVHERSFSFCLPLVRRISGLTDLVPPWVQSLTPGAFPGGGAPTVPTARDSKRGTHHQHQSSLAAA